MDGPSGLTDPSLLVHDFYSDDSGKTIGLQPSPIPYNKDAKGDFDSWIDPPLPRPDINTILPQKPLPKNCLLDNPAYQHMQMQCVSTADYYNKQELRGTDRQAVKKRMQEFLDDVIPDWLGTTPQAVNKRMQEFADDVVRFQPTHIFICWCYSANNDLSLALRGSGVFATMMLAHDLKEITGDPSAKLDATQEEVLREINGDQVRHVILAGSPGAGKTIIGCEGIKMWAARLTREQHPPTVNIYVVNLIKRGELFNVIRKSFAGLAFNIHYVTDTQLCSDQHFNVTYKDYVDLGNKKLDMVDK